MKRLIDGALLGMGFIVVVAAAFALAWAGDILTVDKDGTVKFAVSDAGKITVGATEAYVNLVIQNDEVAAEADNKVDITADVLTVEGIRLESVNVSTNIESSGAGGLDTGSETIDPVNTTWYYIWVITDNDGTLRNGLLSLSSTSPTLPSGYSRKRRVGAVGNTAVTGNFLSFVQEGKTVNYGDGLINNRIIDVGQNTSYTTKSCSNFVPPTSRRVILSAHLHVKHNASDISFILYLKRTGLTVTQGEIWAGVGSVANATMMETSVGSVATDENRNVDYRLNTAPSTSGGAYVDVVGYYDRI